MRYRSLARTDMNVSEISFGAWAIGGSWGFTDDDESLAALHRAVDLGVNFIDTADVYGDGRSERLVARLRKQRPGEQIWVATKAGRRLDPHTADGYSAANLTSFVDRSLTNLATEAIDLLQLHCPPTELYYRPEVFATLDDLVAAGKLRHYGVSVEKIEEGLKAMEYPGVASVQIIFNMFRLRPAGLFLREAAARNVGVLARVPLASGLLTGKITEATTFAPDDHRGFNRHGESFDVGETFSGVDFDVAMRAVSELAAIVRDGESLAQTALRWILMHPAVTCAIPGAKKAAQVEDNCLASDLPALSEQQMSVVADVYERLVGPLVHQRW